jgi:hypothetical protein
MSSEREMHAFNAGAVGGALTGNSPEEVAAYNAGLAQWRNQGGGIGVAAGAPALIAALLLALPALVIGTAMFPVAGILTLVAGALIGGLLDERVGGLVVLAAVLVPCIAVFALGLALEKYMERFSVYRAFRHGARLLVVGYIAHVVVFGFTGAGSYSPNTSFLDRISLVHIIIVIAAVIVAHFCSRKLDARIGSAEAFGTRFRLPALLRKS